MYIAILGRQPEISLAELEQKFGGNVTTPFSTTSALVDATGFSISQLGGTIKAGRVIDTLSRGNWQNASQRIIKHYTNAWANFNGKITLGISSFGFDASAREIQKTGIILKQKLKKDGVSVRLIPNSETALSTATSHHNKLGLAENKVELIVVRGENNSIVIAESVGAQNITAYTKRDRERPRRDMFVGMLPPKLAQIMINLAGKIDTSTTVRPRLLDPFCGTGVILQEAALLGYSLYGTDISEKMIRYTRDNLQWFTQTYKRRDDWHLDADDAIDARWQQPIDAVVSETYLGQPFSAPPAQEKLDAVKRNCNYIISSFLKNLHSQIASGTPVCIAVPAWRDSSGRFTHLPLLRTLETLGYRQHEFIHVKQESLLYFREDQMVARELLILYKK